MGRAPCCDKANVKKGPWSPEEDLKLKDYIEKYGTGGNWIALPQKAGLRRCGKSCRLRWLNYLRPNIRHGEFSEEEDRVICSLYATIGSRWSIIAAQLPGRTDNDIKNYWNTKLKKKLMAFAAASSSSSSTGFIRTPAARPSKPPSLYSSSQSAGDQFTSLYNYKYVPSYSNSSTTTTTTKLKPSLMDKPQAFSCHQMVSSNSNTSSCLETSLSLFQNQQQYYKPLLTFGRSSSVNTDHQQTTSCSSTNSDNGGMINNKQQDAMRSYYNLDNKTIIANGFYEQDEYNKGFMLSGFEEMSNNDVFLSQFDIMINTSSSADAPALLDLYDIENGNRQLSMNINNLSLFDIVDTQNSQQIHQVVNSKINSLDHQLVTKEKDRRRMMMCTALINGNYEC